MAPFAEVNAMSTDLILKICPACHSDDVHEDLPSVLRCYGCGRVWKHAFSNTTPVEGEDQFKFLTPEKPRTPMLDVREKELGIRDPFSLLVAAARRSLEG